MPLFLLVLHSLASQTVMLCSKVKPCVSQLKLFTVISTVGFFFGMFLTSYQKSVIDVSLLNCKLFQGCP